MLMQRCAMTIWNDRPRYCNVVALSHQTNSSWHRNRGLTPSRATYVGIDAQSSLRRESVIGTQPAPVTSTVRTNRMQYGACAEARATSVQVHDELRLSLQPQMITGWMSCEVIAPALVPR